MKICPACQTACPDNDRFCMKCGAALPEQPVQPAAEPAASAAAPVQQPVAPPVQNTVPPVQNAAPPVQNTIPPVQNAAPPVRQNIPPYGGGTVPPAYGAQPPYNYNPYQQQPQQRVYEDISVGKWILYHLIPAIPFVGGLVYIIMLFVWGFGSEKNPTFRNWAKASLLMMLISTVLIIVIVVVALALGFSMRNVNQYYY